MDDLKVTFDVSGIVEKLDILEEKITTGLLMYADVSASKLEAYAKENAPWVDRTGDARKRLRGYATSENGILKIKLAHGVNYGKWLELANEKKYAIIDRTINHVGKTQIMPGLKKLIERFGV